jgi:hypothetical protein
LLPPIPTHTPRTGSPLTSTTIPSNPSIDALIQQNTSLQHELETIRSENKSLREDMSEIKNQFQQFLTLFSKLSIQSPLVPETSSNFVSTTTTTSSKRKQMSDEDTDMKILSSPHLSATNSQNNLNNEKDMFPSLRERQI